MCVSSEKIQEFDWSEHWFFLDSFISYWSMHSFVTNTTITLRINNSHTATFGWSRATFPLPHYTLRGGGGTQLQLTNSRSSDGGDWFLLDRCARKRIHRPRHIPGPGIYLVPTLVTHTTPLSPLFYGCRSCLRLQTAAAALRRKEQKLNSRALYGVDNIKTEWDIFICLPGFTCWKRQWWWSRRCRRK